MQNRKYFGGCTDIEIEQKELVEGDRDVVMEEDAYCAEGDEINEEDLDYDRNDDGDFEEEDSEAPGPSSSQSRPSSNSSCSAHQHHNSCSKEEAVQKRQSELRKTILSIQNDTNIPPQEKAKHIQVYTYFWDLDSV